MQSLDAADEGKHALVDRGGCLAGELLRDHGAHERPERMPRACLRQQTRADSFDQRRQARIAAHQYATRAFEFFRGQGARRLRHEAPEFPGSEVPACCAIRRSASRSLETTLSRPINSSTSNRPGLTAWPVTATRVA